MRFGPLAPLLGLLLLAPAGAQTPAVPQGASALVEELRSLRTTGTVLLVAAHPDDEDTQLIAYFARGRGYRTGYLSLTRGEGGQNLIGPEQGDSLGVIRTQELLAARRIDGGRQFFSRARDFGFSKDYRQTLRRWDSAEVTADIVKVIREFRPDVVITRFSPEPGQTHGHHTASSVLTLEAYRSLTGPEKPRRVLWDAFRPGFRPADASDGIPLEIGGFDPVEGLSFGEIAARSRSMHRSQGMGTVGTRGARSVYLRLLAGEPAGNDPFDGIDTRWSRFPGGEAIDRQIASLTADFQPEHPERSVPALLALRSALTQLAASHPEPLLADKRAQLDRIIAGAAGLFVAATTEPEALPGEAVAVTVSAMVRAPIDVSWDEHGAPLRFNHPAQETLILRVPQRVTQPYWLREDESPGMFRVAEADRALIGSPESPPALSATAHFRIGGQTLAVTAPVEQVKAVPDRGEVHQALAVVPPVSLAFAQPVALLTPGSAADVIVRVTPHQGSANGVLRLQPAGDAAGWTITPAEQRFAVSAPAEFRFRVAAPAHPADLRVGAAAEVGGLTCATDRIVIRYPHIPDQLLQPKARLRAVCVDLKVTARRVGYVAGAGDSVASCLSLMGCTVVPLRPEDLNLEHLRPLDAVVFGIRAFDTRPELAARLEAVFAYVQAGGTVVAQYSLPSGAGGSRFGPYPLTVQRNAPRDRITDENSPVTLLRPDHRALTTPNPISAADFAGWTQERGLNFASSWDSRYEALLASHDPGEQTQAGALLVARYGQGYYVYTGLSFFRQLPAGVPGAYRLFANLISLGTRG